jgi:hypothetical protein
MARFVVKVYLFSSSELLHRPDIQRVEEATSFDHAAASVLGASRLQYAASVVVHLDGNTMMITTFSGCRLLFGQLSYRKRSYGGC